MVFQGANKFDQGFNNS